MINLKFKTVIFYFLILSLCSGCASFNKAIDAFLMKYDTNEYKLITDIRTKASLSKLNCNDPITAELNATTLAELSVTLKNFAEHLPHNEPIQKSSVELDDMVQGYYKQYANNNKVSETFCKIKLNAIEKNATTMQQMEGSKPK